MSSFKDDVALFYRFTALMRKIQHAESMTVARAGESTWILEMRERAVWIALAEDLATSVLYRVAPVPSLLELSIAKVVEMKLSLTELPKTVRTRVKGWSVFLATRNLKRHAKLMDAVVKINQMNEKWGICDYDIEYWDIGTYIV
jgi:hypothetical protein